MKKLARPIEKPPRENTIALINIVFLMLIFFLIAGTLAPPMDGDVALIKTVEAEATAPPQAIFVTENGEVKYQGNVITADRYQWAIEDIQQQGDRSGDQPSNDAASASTVKIAADGKLAASKLIAIIGELKTAGAAGISIITERKNQ